jgi:hypothetical protein
MRQKRFAKKLTGNSTTPHLNSIKNRNVQIEDLYGFISNPNTTSKNNFRRAILANTNYHHIPISNSQDSPKHHTLLNQQPKNANANNPLQGQDSH